MPSLPDSLLRALASGATVVTPNRRLVRGLVALHDAHERAAGRLAWEAARALPWDAWLQTLWQDATLADAVPPGARLRMPAHAAHAWSRIVAANATPLVDRAGAAALAADAWKLVHAWGAGGSSWRGWAEAGDGGDDPAEFARWANRYAAGLGDADVDAAQLADILAGCAARVPAWRDAAIVLAGFVEFSPQQDRLLRALAAAGARVSRADTLPAEPGRAWRAEGATPRDELAQALAWARGRALAAPGAIIGIVVEDLALRRDEVRAMADDVLCPALQWPGELASARPYNLSLGAPLSGNPLVAAALDILDWAAAPLPVGRACALLRSPYVAVGADAWMRRARIEKDWLEEGRRSVTLRAALSALGQTDRALAERWADAAERHRLPASASPRAFAEAFRDRLAAVGWPGSRALDSAELQARVAWDESLAEFATLSAVEARLARAEAVAALRAHVAAKVFQPESPPAPIQILGVLEAAGLPFDALWVAGLAAERWPAAPEPNPLLPIAWQRERGVPHASAARELAYAQALTAQLARAAPEVVFSHATSADDHPRSPSWLLPAAPMLAPGAVAVPLSTARAQFDAAARQEAIVDARAPPIAAGARVRGGAGLIEAQSDCPFKAVAAHRLGAEPWPAPIDGLTGMERGSLVHAALAAFWRDVGDHATLVALAPDVLAKRIVGAVNAAVATLPPGRWRELLPVVADGEAKRLATLVEAWLDAQERPRPPFAVLEVESSLPLAAAGISLRLRLDRVDSLEGGGVAIVDYKTGRVPGPDAWLDARPQAPQLGLYTLARRAAVPTEPVRAVAYAQVRPGEMKVQGLAAEAGAWPALGVPAELKRNALPGWAAVEARWAETLGALAAEVAAGLATVTPRDTHTTCGRCRLQALCRIGALALEDREGDGDE